MLSEREHVEQLPEVDEQIIVAYEGALARIADAPSPEELTGLEASPCVDILLIKVVEFMKNLMDNAPFYYGNASVHPDKLPSVIMLSEQIVLGPYCLLMNAVAGADAVALGRWDELTVAEKKNCLRSLKRS